MTQPCAGLACSEQFYILQLVIGGSLGIFLVLMAGLVLLHFNFKRLLTNTIQALAKGTGDQTKRDEQILEALRLFQISPFGMPEGTVRAAIAFGLVAIGLLILLSYKAIGLTGVGEISGLLGTVLGFYFGTRSGDSSTQQQAQKASNTANSATAEAGQAVATAKNALEAARSAAAQAQEARTASVSAAVIAADSQDEVTRRQLVELRARLDLNRRITRALQQQQSGASVAGDAGSTLVKVDALLEAIDLALKSQVAGADLRELLSKAEAVLPQLEEAGMPGVFGDALATLKGALGSGRQVSAMSANPIEIVGGLVLAGLKLREQPEKFLKWREAMLLQPYDRGAPLLEVNEALAAAVIEYTELAKTRLERHPAGKIAGAIALVKEALARDPQTNSPRVASALAEALIKDASFSIFQDAKELTEAIEEIREAAAFLRVLNDLPEQLDIPGLAPVKLRELLKRVPLLRQDSRVAADLERIAAVMEILKGQTSFTWSELLQAVMDALHLGEALAEKSRQLQEPPLQE